MPIFAWIMISTSLISLGALIGIFTLGMKEKFLNKILLGLVALSSGTLLGGAFIHLLPEGVEQQDPGIFFMIMLGAIILYLLIEKLLHWRHCHKAGGACPNHSSIGHINLIGDAVHNFIDGLIIAATFVVSIPLGITTTIAIAMHEIPQEIGDFGVLLYSGFKKKKALILNFFAAMTIVLGGLVGWIVSNRVESITSYFIPLAAGGFIYIAISDLLPEIRKAKTLKNFFLYFFILLLGIGLMFLVKLVGAE